MLPENRIATHPGEILANDFLLPLGLHVEQLAEHLALPVGRVRSILDCDSPVDADVAWRLSMALDTTPEFWLNLQAAHDLTRTRPTWRLAKIAG